MVISKQDILETISTLTVIELYELIKEFEKKFEISAEAMAVSSATNINKDASKLKVVEEQTEFSVSLIEIGVNKVSVIKTVREITGLGLKDAKDLVDSAPKMIKENVSKVELESIRKKLEEAGAKIEVK